MFGIGPMELMMILVVALLVFGPKRVPELARTLGRGLAEFRKASNDLRHSLALDDLQKDLNSDPTQTIHRPNADGLDRPAQAGDNSSPPTPTTRDSGSESESTNADSAGTNAGADADAGTRETDGAQPETPHSGELPLNEEHDYAHHGESGPDGKGNQTASSETATDARGSETSDRTDKSAGQAANLTADRPIDSELGNVPVGSTKSPSRPRG